VDKTSVSEGGTHTSPPMEGERNIFKWVDDSLMGPPSTTEKLQLLSGRAGGVLKPLGHGARHTAAKIGLEPQCRICDIPDSNARHRVPRKNSSRLSDSARRTTSQPEQQGPHCCSRSEESASLFKRRATRLAASACSVLRQRGPKH